VNTVRLLLALSIHCPPQMASLSTSRACVFFFLRLPLPSTLTLAFSVFSSFPLRRKPPLPVPGSCCPFFYWSPHPLPCFFFPCIFSFTRFALHAKLRRPPPFRTGPIRNFRVPFPPPSRLSLAVGFSGYIAAPAFSSLILLRPSYSQIHVPGGLCPGLETVFVYAVPACIDQCSRAPRPPPPSIFALV